MNRKVRRKFSLLKTIRTLIILFLILVISLFGIVKFRSYLIDKKIQEEKAREELLLKQKIEAEQQKFENDWQQVFKEDDKEYPIIKLDINDKYEGIGQQTFKNKEGYFNTFTTVDKHKKTYIEYKQNGNSPWKDNPYWGEIMADTGCGLAVMSTLLSGYGYDLTPEELRQKYYPVLDYSTLSKVLLDEYNVKSSDFYYGGNPFKKETILEHLKSNRPIIVCLWSKIENRWTTRSHFMLLLGATDDGLVYVSNPNGLFNSSKSSGWYDIDEITPYLAKIMYIKSYE